MLIGTAKCFKKGYGFIAPDDGCKDAYVHSSSILKDGYKALQEGQTVELEVKEGKNDQEAINAGVL